MHLSRIYYLTFAPTLIEHLKERENDANPVRNDAAQRNVALYEMEIMVGSLLPFYIRI